MKKFLRKLELHWMKISGMHSQIQNSRNLKTQFLEFKDEVQEFQKGKFRRNLIIPFQLYCRKVSHVLT